MFKGSIVALITPFKNSRLDENSFAKMMKFQIEAQTDGVVIAGTTGESSNLNKTEINEMFDIASSIRKEMNSNIQIIIGTGSNSTESAVQKTEFAKTLQPDGMLVVTPYYNKPTQDGLYLHFEEIARVAHPFPIILYNVPGRTGCNMHALTTEKLSKIENVAAIKEASGNLAQISEIYMKACAGSKKGFTILSGDDALTLPILSIGGSGVISVTANVAPKLVKKCVTQYLSGDIVAARETHYELFELHDAMFLESNPIPVKTAMSMMGLCEEEFRLPLSKISATARVKLSEVMKKYGLI
ncbi:MAG TPA: 4-hydroxy-tetrahydrodipicolinate synthase [Candidatus Wallbacteria bacterium]|nr:4-hydroxy-tetrahydrodipicolinate synthase [Candidatus Wallbacteria bacterium]